MEVVEGRRCLMKQRKRSLIGIRRLSIAALVDGLGRMPRPSACACCPPPPVCISSFWENDGGYIDLSICLLNAPLRYAFPLPWQCCLGGDTMVGVEVVGSSFLTRALLASSLVVCTSFSIDLRSLEPFACHGPPISVHLCVLVVPSEYKQQCTTKLQ